MADTQGDGANSGGFDLAAVSEAVCACRREDGEVELCSYIAAYEQLVK